MGGGVHMRPDGPLGFIKTWSKKTWIIVGCAAAVVIIVVIVAPVEVAKKNAYPTYAPIRYTLSDTYSGSDFFDNFNYFTSTDPTHGLVTYVDEDTASSLNLTYATTSSAVLRVDTSDGSDDSPDSGGAQRDQANQGGQQQQRQQGGQRRRRATTTPAGRRSVRVTSKAQYGSGLFIFDVRHTPHGCGTWPALWLSDPDNWPAHGEIDVMEAVNLADAGNQVTLHTARRCGMDHRRRMTGSALHETCYWAANDEAGCGVRGGGPTFGPAFNAAGGGVTAVEWRPEGIRVWQFVRGGVPGDIASDSPDPSTWGTALADFPGTGCDIGTHFRNQSIIINIDLCGDWAGGSSYAEAGCPSNCTDFVANNPSNFTDAYWEFGSFQVYQKS